jgi:O-antigen/teichoic acid export membrane protein
VTTQKSFRHAIKWAYVMQGSDQALNVLFTFIFAILLGPRDFGTVAIAMAYILFVKLILEQGFLPALVARKDLQKEHLDSVFCLNVVVSLILVIVSVGASKMWARANHLPILVPVISVLSLTLILEGLTIVQRAVLERNLDFRSFSIRSVVANLIGGAVGLGMALKGYGLWALVGKQLSSDLLGVIVLWRLSDWRPGLRVSRNALKELMSYSVGSFTGNLGVWLNGQVDTLVIGLFFGPVAVGLYRLAGRIPFMVVSGAISSLQAAAFPQFCRIQDRPGELRKSILSCFRMASLLSVPTLAGLALVSKPLLSMLGTKWAGASSAMSILCFVAMVQAIGLFIAPLLQAVSQTHFLAMIEWGNTALVVGSIALAGQLLKHGSTTVQVTGIAVARFGIAVLIFLPFLIWTFQHFAGFRSSAMLKVMVPSFVSAATMTCVVAIVMVFAATHNVRVVPSLVVEICAGAFTVLMTLLCVDADLRGRLSKYIVQFRSSEVAIARPPSMFKNTP